MDFTPGAPYVHDKLLEQGGIREIIESVFGRENTYYRYIGSRLNVHVLLDGRCRLLNSLESGTKQSSLAEGSILHEDDWISTILLYCSMSVFLLQVAPFCVL